MLLHACSMGTQEVRSLYTPAPLPRSPADMCHWGGRGCVIPRPRCTIGLCMHHRGRRQAQITFDSGMVATRQMPPHALFHPHLSWGGCDDRYHTAIPGSRLGRVCASIGHERGRCPIYRVRTLSLQLLDDARPMSCRVFGPLSRW